MRSNQTCCLHERKSLVDCRLLVMWFQIFPACPPPPPPFPAIPKSPTAQRIPKRHRDGRSSVTAPLTLGAGHAGSPAAIRKGGERAPEPSTSQKKKSENFRQEERRLPQTQEENARRTGALCFFARVCALPPAPAHRFQSTWSRSGAPSHAAMAWAAMGCCNMTPLYQSWV